MGEFVLQFEDVREIMLAITSKITVTLTLNKFSIRRVKIA